MPKYGVISGPYFPIFGLNTGKYGPEITPYLDTFHAVSGSKIAQHQISYSNDSSHKNLKKKLVSNMHFRLQKNFRRILFKDLLPPN